MTYCIFMGLFRLITCSKFITYNIIELYLDSSRLCLNDIQQINMNILCQDGSSLTLLFIQCNICVVFYCIETVQIRLCKHI